MAWFPASPALNQTYVDLVRSVAWKFDGSGWVPLYGNIAQPGDIKANGTVPFTATQTGVVATAPTHLTTLGQFTWPIITATYSYTIAVRRIWTDIGISQAIPTTGKYVIMFDSTDTVASTEVGARILVNGTVVATCTGLGWNSVGGAACAVALVSAVAGQIVTFEVNCNTNGAVRSGTWSIQRVNGV